MATIPPQSLPPAELEALLQLTGDAKTTSYFAVAALTFLVYDHVLSFNLENMYTLAVPKFFILYLIPSLVVSFTMFVMTIYNCHARLGLTLHSRNAMPLVNLFLRGGIYWFLAVVAVNPPQIILWAVGRLTLTELLIIPSIVVYSIIGSRILLNIMENILGQQIQIVSL
ncbi:hypothetical protein C8R44DRAFT_876836 [Mycena epipterygia]|nr:hypothetical protein C8R44DRAFT_876836 [Mycena epipterygia]